MKTKYLIIISFFFTAIISYGDQLIMNQLEIESVLRTGEKDWTDRLNLSHSSQYGNYFVNLRFIGDDRILISTKGKIGVAETTIFGEYEIKGESIILKTPNDQWNKRGNLFLTEQPMPAYYINFDDETTVWKQIRLKKGASFSFQGIPLIALGEEMITTDDVRIRTGPSTQDTSLSWKEVTWSESNEEYPYLFKDFAFFVSGRTLNKVQIGEWLNYWYLIEVRDAYINNELNAYLQVWAFGEFFKPPVIQFIEM